MEEVVHYSAPRPRVRQAANGGGSPLISSSAQELGCYLSHQQSLSLENRFLHPEMDKGATYSHGPHSLLHPGLRQLESPALSPSGAFLMELFHLTEFLGLPRLSTLAVPPRQMGNKMCVTDRLQHHPSTLLYSFTLLLYSPVPRRVTWTNLR